MTINFTTHKHYFLFLLLISLAPLQAQTKDPSAILQLDSTTQGMLPPRMTTTQRDAIATPAQGLVIYNTDTNQYNYWNSTTWTPLLAGGNSTLVDADGDTQIQVEESTDEDVIRFDVGGNERTVINNNGLAIKATPVSSVDLAIGDADTGIDGSAGELEFISNGNERAVVNNNGLGIKTAPDSSVDLAIGDSDTGLNQTADGDLSIVLNGTSLIDLDGTNVRINNGSMIDANTVGNFMVGNTFRIGIGSYSGENNSPWIQSHENRDLYINPLGNGVIIGPPPSSITGFNLHVSGSAAKSGGGSWSNVSDQRIKTDIQPYKKGLKEILQIEPVSYRYNDKSPFKNPDNGRPMVGIIAQDMRKILPNTIDVQQVGEIEDLLSFDSSELIYTLINAIKALKAENEALQARVLALEKE